MRRLIPGLLLCLAAAPALAQNTQAQYLNQNGSQSPSVAVLCPDPVTPGQSAQCTFVSGSPATQAQYLNQNGSQSPSVILLCPDGANPGHTVACTFSGGGGGSPGGTNGQVQYNNAGSFGGFTVSGDGTLNTTTGALAVTKTGGVAFGALATLGVGTGLTSSGGNVNVTTVAPCSAFGTAAGTCAQGNDARFPASTPLLASNNLSDVASATTSLSNLGGAPLASPALSGIPTAPTAAANTNTTQLATTAFVIGQGYGAGNAIFGTATGNTTNDFVTMANATTGVKDSTLAAPASAVVGISDSQSLSNKTLASPALSGTVTGANTIPLTILAQGAANTIVSNATGGTANFTAVVMPGCSSAGNALNWTLGTGPTCRTGLATLASPTFTGTVALPDGTSSAVAGLTLGSAVSGGTSISSSNAAGYRLASGAASATAPTIIPNRGDTSSGLGANANGVIDLVAATVDVARVSATAFTEITGQIVSKGYTVGTLPTGIQGGTAFVTDAVACTFLASLTGGGSTVCPVFYNGTAWIGG